MKPDEPVKMYPLQPILECIGVKEAAFRQHLHKGVLRDALAGVGQLDLTVETLATHMSMPMRGTGIIRGGGRFVTVEGAICLGVFFRLVSGGISSSDALRMAHRFIFGMEDGKYAIRAFKPGKLRPAGEVFPGPHDTYLVAIANAPIPDLAECDGFAFIAGPDLTARELSKWLGRHEAESAAVCLVNLSELIADIRVSLEDLEAVAIDVDYLPGTPAQDWPDLPSDPVVAFLSEHVDRNPRGRTPALDFRLAFSVWYVRWKGEPIADRGKHGRGVSSVLGEALADLGVRKMKSNGKLTFAGIQWRETPATQALLSNALGRE